VDKEVTMVQHSGDGHVLESFGEVIPDLQRFELELAFHHEAVVLSQVATLMISPDQKELARIFEFQQEQKDEGLDAMRSPVDIVAQKHKSVPSANSPAFE
jgi:hypothetical protein